jgi:hypothetical protein
MSNFLDACDESAVIGCHCRGHSNAFPYGLQPLDSPPETCSVILAAQKGLSMAERLIHKADITHAPLILARSGAAHDGPVRKDKRALTPRSGVLW